MRLLITNIAIILSSINLLSQSVFTNFSYWQRGKPVTGYEYSYESIVLIPNGIILSRRIDSTVVFSPEGVVYNTPIQEIYHLRKDSISTLYWDTLNPNLISPQDEFTHHMTKTYKIQGESIVIHCYGFIGQVIDGDYAIYVSFKYGFLGHSNLNWGTKSLLVAEDKKLKKLIKKLRKDKSFFMWPRFNDKHKIN